MQQREQWKSGLGFALAAAGSAVGLGNLWGFAYRSSQGGGLAFLILYVLDVLSKDLKVIDASAVSLARENNIPLIISSIFENGNLLKIFEGKGVFTIVN